MPKVSIITPCYNARRYIAATMRSVQAQSFEDWEHIVVDDGSTDGSMDVIDRLSRQDSSGRIRAHRQKNQGVCRARNVGLELASDDSEYILFLDADDCLKPEMLKVLTAYLDSKSEVGLAYCLFDKIDQEGNTIDSDCPRLRYQATRFWMEKVPESEPDTPALTVFEGSVLPSVSLIRKRFLPKGPLFDEVLNIQPDEDADAFTRIAIRAPVHQISQSLVQYRIHPSQSTQNSRANTRRQLVEKWKLDLEGLTVQQQDKRRRIWFDYLGRSVPLLLIREAKRRIGGGQYLSGSILLGRAAAHYSYYSLYRISVF